MIIGVATGIVVFLLTGAVLGQFVLHNNQAGIFPGLVAGIWAAWPLLCHGKVQRYNFLHPVPRRYQLPARHAFSKVRTVIDDKVYNYGDRWKILTADTQARRIHAMLQFSDDEDRGDNKQRVQRMIEMNVQLKVEPNDATIVQFNFRPKVEGVAYHACDAVISALLADVQASLGANTEAANPAAVNLPAPPWWLLGLTAWTLYIMWGDVMAAVFKP